MMTIILALIGLFVIYYVIKLLVKNGKINMPIITNLFKAVKGNATEVGEAIVDANSITIMNEEILETDEEIEKAKKALAKVQVQKDSAVGRIDSINRHKAARETQIKAVNNSEPLKKSLSDNINILAEEIVACDDLIAREQNLVDNIDLQITKLEEIIQRTIATLKIMKHKTRICEINEEVIEVQQHIGVIGGDYVCKNSKLDNMNKMLERIQTKQRETVDENQKLIDIDNKYPIDNCKLLGYNDELDLADKEEKIKKVIDDITTEKLDG